MRTRFDHIIKTALENYVAPMAPDWAVFYDLLEIEQAVPLTDDADLEMDFGTMLAGMEYNESPSDWASFETRLDDLNIELDREFDQSIREALDTIPENTWGSGQWNRMSSRLDDVDREFDQTIGDALESIPAGAWGAAPWSAFESRVDDLNRDLDQEFDQAIGDAITGLPESTWKEDHWHMLSSRLDQLNDRPRLIMMKVIEAAAILILLIQLTNLYSDYHRKGDRRNNLTENFEEFLQTKTNSTEKESSDILTQDPASHHGIKKDHHVSQEHDQLIGNSDHVDDPLVMNSDQSISGAASKSTSSARNADNNYAVQSATTNYALDTKKESEQVMKLPLPEDTHVFYEYDKNLVKLSANYDKKNQAGITPQLTSPAPLIEYEESLKLMNQTSPRLAVRDISLLTTKSSDSILNSIPVFQVIRPRIHSSMEVGVLADATNVEVQDYLLLNQEPISVPTLNAGMYFRYKIQYQDMFGSLGGDYLRMKYDGLSNTNDLSIVTLPVEIGYNVVNLPAIRMYFSGGIAGRFVPLANYSTETLNQASGYSSKSNKPSNGLLHNGPFEINSYFSGRLSAGMDINVNKKTSINLRFSHDIWLKGRGIGYNLDKFRSSHLAIGANHHF